MNVIIMLGLFGAACARFSKPIRSGSDIPDIWSDGEELDNHCPAGYESLWEPEYGMSVCQPKMIRLEPIEFI